MADAIDGKHHPLGLSDEAGEQGGVIVPAAIVAQQHAAFGLQHGAHLLHAAGSATDIEHRLRWEPYGHRVIGSAAMMLVQQDQLASQNRSIRFGVLQVALTRLTCAGQLNDPPFQALAPPDLAGDAALQVSQGVAQCGHDVVRACGGRGIGGQACQAAGRGVTGGHGVLDALLLTPHLGQQGGVPRLQGREPLDVGPVRRADQVGQHVHIAEDAAEALDPDLGWVSAAQ